MSFIFLIPLVDMPPHALPVLTSTETLRFLLVSDMDIQLAFEVGLLDAQRLVLGPLIDAHLLYQAEIEKLGIVRPGRCLIRIGVKMVAGKIRTFITESNAFLARAAEYGARLVVAQ
jgi:hypothetical protein